ncbi:MAG: sigma-54-dependent Fis family transcriptional regulator [Deltaproteobacteria bacterium]|nr:sigma-54-dependent Fis family transcriptional regulator [Deltaproteobacteria bacterium]
MAFHILWIDDEPGPIESTVQHLKSSYRLTHAASLPDGLVILQRDNIDLVLLDISIGAENGLQGLQKIKTAAPSSDVVMVSAITETPMIVHAIREGAVDYLCKPFKPAELAAVVEKAKAARQMRDHCNAYVAESNPIEARSHFIGVSPAFRRVLEQAGRLKGHVANILIDGESGTGKELLARHIHGLENNSRRPFIAVNCAAIPEGLIEAELFGHERGAFTGATQRRIGKFELASGGDIFLDEISALRLDLQAKILRALQEKEIVRVGGSTPVRAEFRVLSATNEPLEQLVARGDFRMDLYHRLRVIQLHLPALRDRREDIALLITHFLGKFGKTAGAKRITDEAMQRLQAYAWPGNVRELENAVHSLMILTPGDIIAEEHLPAWTLGDSAERPARPAQLPGMQGEDRADLPALRDYIRHAERSYITHVLKKHEGDKSMNASALAVGRTKLYGKLRELGLHGS